MSLKSVITSTGNPGIAFGRAAAELPGAMNEALTQAQIEINRTSNQPTGESSFKEKTTQEFKNEAMSSELVRMYGPNVFLGDRSSFAGATAQPRSPFALEEQDDSLGAQVKRDDRDEMLREALENALRI